jgi:isopentenyl diphosphate isomerase/L-lactate dehydrogenase-like FMN-dependent dehydrogenase
MANLSTRYMGLQLKNPVIVGASNLVKDVDNCKKMEDAGAAAIVYKTLFEEQIELERLQMSEELNQYNDRHAEMISLFPDIDHAGSRAHLSHLKKVVDAVNIPVIASLNCTFDETWVEYARQLENTGINALELNFYAIPGDFKREGKGIQDVEDARLAVNSGADALIVSNHGGRQLDGAQSSIGALPAIVDAVGKQIEVHMDGGIRSGQDVLKARALGAQGTYIGRAMLYGLGAMGEAGVTKALELIHKELDLTMAFCGRTQIDTVDKSILLPGTFPV